MDGFKAYKYYIAIKLHFTKDNFDVFKNRGNVKGTRDAFNARNDRYMFEKLARKYPVDKDLIQYYVANFAYGNDAAIYSFEEAETNLLEWNRRKQSITKIFADDCNKILMDACKNKITEESIFNLTNKGYSSILKLFLGNQISLESLRIIDDLYPVIDSWKENSSMVLLWENEIRRIEKSKGFVKYDNDKVAKVFNNFIQEIKEL
jgi:hypothetical protein